MKHFNHPHVLQRTKFNESSLGGATCPGCINLFALGEDCYACITCRYVLHAACAELPILIQDQQHKNDLYIVSGGSQWNCDICDRDAGSRGFWYKCSHCDFRSHGLCSHAADTIRTEKDIAAAAAAAKILISAAKSRRLAKHRISARMKRVIIHMGAKIIIHKAVLLAGSSLAGVVGVAGVADGGATIASSSTNDPSANVSIGDDGVAGGGATIASSSTNDPSSATDSIGDDSIWDAVGTVFDVIETYFDLIFN